MTQRIIRVPETPAYAVSVSVTHAILYKYFIANINCSLVLSIKIILRKISKSLKMPEKRQIYSGIHRILSLISFFFSLCISHNIPILVINRIKSIYDHQQLFRYSRSYPFLTIHADLSKVCRLLLN